MVGLHLMAFTWESGKDVYWQQHHIKILSYDLSVAQGAAAQLKPPRLVWRWGLRCASPLGTTPFSFFLFGLVCALSDIVFIA